MPWKIVNLDHADRPHLHLKDPNAPIHLRTFFADQRVEIGLGADDPEDCFVRATVTADEVTVKATKFEPLHVQILSSIFASLDVEPRERDAALAWMQDRVRAAGGRSAGTRGERGEGERAQMLRGNVDEFPPPSGWPYDLTDESLLESLDDREGAPHTRVNALLREARRRGLRAPAGDAGRSPRGPEVVHRRPR